MDNTENPARPSYKDVLPMGLQLGVILATLLSAYNLGIAGIGIRFIIGWLITFWAATLLATSLKVLLVTGGIGGKFWLGSGISGLFLFYAGHEILLGGSYLWVLYWLVFNFIIGKIILPTPMN